MSPQEAEAVDRYQELCDKVAEQFQQMYADLAEEKPISRERFPELYEYGSVITGDLLKRFFKHPLLIGVYSTYYGYLGIPVDVCPFVCMALCYQRRQGTCYVKGGNAAISAAVTDEFIKHGGTVKLNTAVEKILVEDGAVKGVRCTNGEEFYADTVLTNCNKILTYIDMIDEQYVPEQVLTICAYPCRASPSSSCTWAWTARPRRRASSTRPASAAPSPTPQRCLPTAST